MLALRNRLSYKQAKWALCLILLMSLLTSVYQILADWQEEKANIHSRVKGTLETIENAAVESAYTLDANLAKQVLTGLMKTNVFYELSIKDDLGNEMAYSHRTFTVPPHYWLSKRLFDDLSQTYTVELVRDQLIVGTLIANIDYGAVTENYIRRSIRLIATTLLVTAILGLAILTLIYFQTSRPLTRLIEQLERLGEKSNSRGEVSFSESKRSDELGVLARTFTVLWHQRKQVENELEKSEAYFRAVLHQSSECMLLTSLNGQILDCNDEARRLLGYSSQTLLSMNLQAIDPNFDQARLEDWAKESLGEVRTFEASYICQDDTQVPVEVCGNIITLDTYPLYLVSARDITQRLKDQEQVRYLAYYDALTSLPNRRLLHDRLDNAIEVARNHSHIGGVLFIDLDRFKTINDSMGHHVGDSLLVEVSKRISTLLSKGDTASRLGGDEFVLLLPELSSELHEAQSKVSHLAELLLETLNDAFLIQHVELFVSASIGISLFPLDQSNGMRILQQADIAMYKAKENGRSSFHFYKREMQQYATERLRLEKALHYAIERSELYLVYQPQVNRQGELIGFEALVRWNSAELGQISPSRFIPIAEDTGLIVPLGEWVLTQACTQLRRWQQTVGLPESFRSLAVNISPYQFSRKDFVEQVQRVIEKTQVSPNLLELEITEGMLVENIKAVAGKMQRLKEQGLHFSIDDFGTGYSSLRYLQHLPLDQLKIDQSFVRDISDDPNSYVIINTIISMAKYMQLSVLAEGVEMEFEKDVLMQVGCSLFQGYYFARPVEGDIITGYLEKKLFFPHPADCNEVIQVEPK